MSKAVGTKIKIALLTVLFAAACMAGMFLQLADTARAINARDEALKGYRFVQVAGGVEHTIGLTAEGDVYVWGKNSRGQLGFIKNPTGGTKADLPKLDLSKPTLLISAELSRNGNARVRNSYSDTANGAQSLQYSFTQINDTGAYTGRDYTGWTGESDKIVQVSALEYGSLALTSTGNVLYWGDNTYGQGNYPIAEVGGSAAWMEAASTKNADDDSLTNDYSNAPGWETAASNPFGVYIIPRPRLVRYYYDVLTQAALSENRDRFIVSDVSAGARHFLSSGSFKLATGSVKNPEGFFYASCGDNTYNQTYLVSDTLNNGDFPIPPQLGTKPENSNNGGLNGQPMIKAENAPFGAIATDGTGMSVYAGGNMSLYQKGKQFSAAGKNYLGYAANISDNPVYGVLGSADLSTTYFGRNFSATADRFVEQTLTGLDLKTTSSYYVNNASGVKQVTTQAGDFTATSKNAVSLGTDFGYAVDLTGKSLYAWGDSNKGQFSSLYSGSPQNSGVYNQKASVDFTSKLTTEQTIVQVAAGKYRVNDNGTDTGASIANTQQEKNGKFVSAVLTSDGKVYAWGNLDTLRINRNPTENTLDVAPALVEIPGNPTIVSVASGYGKLYMISSVGRVYTATSDASSLSPVDMATATLQTSLSSISTAPNLSSADLTKNTYFKSAYTTNPESIVNGFASTADGDAIKWIIPENKNGKALTASGLKINGSELRAETDASKNFGAGVGTAPDSLKYKVNFYNFNPETLTYDTLDTANSYDADSEFVKKYVDISFVAANISSQSGAVLKGASDIIANSAINSTALNVSQDIVLSIRPVRRVKLQLTAYIGEYDAYSAATDYTTREIQYNQIHPVKITYEVTNNALLPVMQEDTVISDYSLDANISALIAKDNKAGDHVKYNLADIIGNASAVAGSEDYYYGIYGINKALGLSGSEAILPDGALSGEKAPYGYFAKDFDGDVLRIVGDTVSADFSEYFEYVYVPAGETKTVSDGVSKGVYHGYIIREIDGDRANDLSEFVKNKVFGNFTVTGIGFSAETGKTTFQINYGYIMLFAKKAVPASLAASSKPAIAFTLTDSPDKDRTTGFSSKRFTLTFKTVASMTMKITPKDGPNVAYNNKLSVESKDTVLLGAPSGKDMFFVGESEYTLDIATLFGDSTDLYFADIEGSEYNNTLMTVTAAANPESGYTAGNRLLKIKPLFETNENGAIIFVTVQKALPDGGFDAKTLPISVKVNIRGVYTISAYATSDTIPRTITDPTAPGYKDSKISEYFKTQRGISTLYSPTDFFKTTGDSAKLKFVTAVSGEKEILDVNIIEQDGKTYLKFVNNYIGVVELHITVSDDVGNSLTAGFKQLSVEGVHVAMTLKVKTKVDISAVSLTGQVGLDPGSAQPEFIVKQDGTVDCEVYDSEGLLLVENPHFSMTVNNNTVTILPIKASKTLSAVFRMRVNSREYSIKIGIEVWTFDALSQNDEIVELVLQAGGGKGAEEPVAAQDLINGKLGHITGANNININSSQIMRVELLGNPKEGADIPISFGYSPNQIMIKAEQNGLQALRVFYHDTSSGNHFTVNFNVRVTGITTVLDLKTYITIFAASAAGTLLLLAIIFLVRFILFAKKSAEQKKVIKKNRMLIHMRDRMHSKNEMSTKENIVKTKMKMQDPKYAKMFDEMRRTKEEESGVVLNNSDLAKNVSTKVAVEDSKKKKKYDKSTLEEMRRQLLEKQQAVAAMQGAGADYGTPPPPMDMPPMGNDGILSDNSVILDNASYNDDVNPREEIDKMIKAKAAQEDAAQHIIIEDAADNGGKKKKKK